MKIAIIITAILLVAVAAPAAYATTTRTNSYYTDISKGFRVQVPDGWVVDEINKTDSSINEYTIPDFGIEFLIAMCPEEISLPTAGRLHICPNTLPSNATGFFQLYRFLNLQDRPELAAPVQQQGEPITTDDLLTLYIDYQRNITFYDPYVYHQSIIQLVTDEDIEVNIVDPQNNNQTVGAAQAKFVEYTHTDSNGNGSYKQSALLVLSDDSNTGYVVRPILVQLSNQELPEFVMQVINSFELIAASGAGEADDAINLE
jgi:hypothetical protein